MLPCSCNNHEQVGLDEKLVELSIRFTEQDLPVHFPYITGQSHSVAPEPD